MGKFRKGQSQWPIFFNLEDADSVGALDKEKMKERMVNAIREEQRVTNTFNPHTRVSSIEGGNDTLKNILNAEIIPPTKGGSKVGSSKSSTSSRGQSPSELLCTKLHCSRF